MGATYLKEHDCYIRFTELQGEDDVRVYLHGLGGAAPNYFAGMATHPALQGHRSLLIDLLGHGYSDAPHTFSYQVDDHARTVVHILDDLGISTCKVIGQSLGGSVAIWAAALRPDIVSHLVVMEGNLDAGGDGANATIARQDEQAFFDQGWPDLKDWVRQYSPDWYGVVQHLDPYAVYWSARGSYEGTVPTAREQLYQLDMPRAFIVGEQSLPNPRWDELPAHGVQITTVPDAGHNMGRDNPDGTAEAIARALLAHA